MLRIALLIAAIFAGAVAAEARDVDGDPHCAADALAFAPTGDLASVADYRNVLKICRSPGGQTLLATRAFSISGQRGLLLVDPNALTTRVARAACWTCEDASDAALAETRLMRAIQTSSAPPPLAARGVFTNAGLVHGAAAGAYVTGDLCPSPRPLDRPFFDSLAAASPHAPVALAISGVWLERHGDDFAWLTQKRLSGALDILWVNHSFHHPYSPTKADAHNYLLKDGVDMESEIYDTERLLIAHGETPSAFFRFPGLVSDSALMREVRAAHLIDLGADAWLALAQRPVDGSIVLVHPNGNEEIGLRLFARTLAAGTLPRPLEPLTAAPP